MGQPVVHFEVIGKDGPKMREFYAELFDWKFSDPMGPSNYSVTPPDGNREENTNDDGVGIGGGVGSGPEGYDGHVTFYVEVDDVEVALQKAEELGGSRMMGPEEMGDIGITIGLFTDPEGHTIGLVK